MALQQTKFTLPEDRIPRAWYNINADLPVPLSPPLHPGTKQPIGPEDLAPLFPMALIAQEMSTERYIEIPEPVLQAYTMYRPSPLFRAHRLEQALGYPGKIFYKYEGGSPAGSHKPNTAIPQAYYNKARGHRASDHRDRSRAVGHGPGHGRCHLRPRGDDLPGASLV